MKHNVSRPMGFALADESNLFPLAGVTATALQFQLFLQFLQPDRHLNVRYEWVIVPAFISGRSYITYLYIIVTISPDQRGNCR